jgi:pyridoxal/pyridoxine/pyridoxamine kinase
MHKETHYLWFSGYIGSVSFLETVLQVVEKLRSVNPDLVYGKSFSHLWLSVC